MSNLRYLTLTLTLRDFGYKVCQVTAVFDWEMGIDSQINPPFSLSGTTSRGRSCLEHMPISSASSRHIRKGVYPAS